MNRICIRACSLVVGAAIAFFGLACVGSFGSQAYAAEADCACIPGNPECYVADELIVSVHVDGSDSHAAQAEAEEIVQDVPEAYEDSVVYEDETGDDVIQVELDHSVSLEQAEHDIAKVPGVVAVQPNYKYFYTPDELAEQSTTTTWGYADLALNDDDLKNQYYLGSFASDHGANFKAAWNKAKCNSDVTVAVLDTGFYLEHEDLRGNLLTSYAWDASTNAAIASVNEGVTGHGTHVAGVIAAQANNGTGIAGTSYNADILPIKVFSNSGSCTTANLIRAFTHIFDLIKGHKVSNLHVINMSLGDYDADDHLLEKEINTARYTYNIVSVCSGGNGDADNDTSSAARTENLYPSDFDACVSVTALDTDGTNAPYSDYNMHKDISAPGNRIYSTHVEKGWYWSDYTLKYGPRSTYEYLSGTSMAAPIASGAFALLWAKQPNLSVSRAISAIYSTATPVVKTKYDRTGKTGSRGCVDAASALDYLSGLTSLSKASVSVSNRGYTGSAVKPAPVVKLGGKTLRAGTDYTVSYKNNTNPGTASVTVKGVGYYTGSVTKTFKITLPTKVVQVINKKVTGVNVKMKNRRFVISHNKVANATGYKSAYRLKGTKTWYVGKTKKLSWKSSKIKKKGVYQVRVRPYIVYKKHTFWGKWSTVLNVRYR